ncbi:MAG: NADH-quinone oxidoreductase subunit M [Candidatus Caldarchaeum sp.]|nr:NADH-quinone oxidoreductase subunit M [Candidatus Caldarchaeum sp.]MDW7977620.1 NADH-quinone oxidoreductase subunit M [Candidatus Caldarchaeum sp.]MDW8360244.1 NADH-quinone oxidoreductase subunit M [Candidatus Caldarchaeum sp.]
MVNFTPALNTLIIFTVFSPIFSLVSRRLKAPFIVDAYGFSAFAISLIVAFFQAQSIFGGAVYRIALGPYSSVIYVDSLSSFLSLIFIGVGLLASIFSVGYIEERKPEFYPLLIALVTGMVGVVFSGDLFTFFIFWEMMSIASYLLVAFRYRSWEAVEASLKYLIISAAGASAILFGMSLLYGMAGTLEIARLAESLGTAAAAGEAWTYVAIVFLVTGFGVNAAMAPFHSWLPDAHPAAPSSISAMLSGVVIKTGVYGLFRLILGVFPPTMYDWGLGLAVFAVLTMTIGNLLALMQEDIKRLLAFSSIAHIGYIVFGLSVANVPGIAGGLFHVLNHALVKALLFLGAGVFIHSAATRSIENLAGIGKKLPLPSTCFAIGAFALAGIPGLNVFWSEFTIITAALQAGQIYVALAVVMVINILIGVAYYVRLIQSIFLKEPSPALEKLKPVNASMTAPLIVLTSLAVIIGIYPTPFLDAALLISSALAS